MYIYIYEVYHPLSSLMQNLNFYLTLRFSQSKVLQYKTDSTKCNESFKNWEAKGGVNASVDEVKSLTNLTNLNLVASDINLIINPKDNFSGRLERFNILLGPTGA